MQSVYLVKFPSGEYSSFSPTDENKLGRGATADVYRFQHAGKSFAAKILKGIKTQDCKKIDAMVSMGSTSDTLVRSIAFRYLTWPSARIEKDGELVGFAMPVLDPSDFIGLESFLDFNLRRNLPSQDFLSISLLVDLARRLAEILALLHSLEIYVVDLKPQNIRISKKDLSVHILDCDGFSVKAAERRFPAEHVSADYICPEASRNNLLPTGMGEGQDRYTFAVIAFQLFNKGIHPFQGVISNSSIDAPTNDKKAELDLYAYGLVENANISPNPRSVHTNFPASLRSLFDRAFTQTDLMRPSLEEWRDYFSSLASRKQFSKCQQYPLDATHIHFSEGSCIECFSQSLSNRTVWRTGFVNPIIQPEELPSPSSVAQKKSTNALWIGLLVIFLVLVVWISNDNRSASSSSQSVNSTSINQKTLRTLTFEVGDFKWDGYDLVITILNKEKARTFDLSSIWMDFSVVGCGDIVATKSELFLIQTSLANRGYSVIPDGKYGPRTRAALIDFQNKARLSSTGLVTEETARALGVSVAYYGDLKGTVPGYPSDGYVLLPSRNKKITFRNFDAQIPSGECFQYIIKGNYLDI